MTLSGKVSNTRVKETVAIAKAETCDVYNTPHNLDSVLRWIQI